VLGGVVEEGVERGGVVGWDPVEAEGGQFGRDRVVADGQGAAVQGGLDQRGAEALPGRGEEDGVAGGVGVVHGQSVGDSSVGSGGGGGEQAFELGGVAVLGRAGQPVVSGQGFGHGQAGGHVLAGDGPGRLEEQPAVGGDPAAAPGPCPP